MEDTALPSQAPLVSGSGGHVAASKSESRKRFGLADQFRPRLSRGNLALSRQYSFDVGTDTVDASSPDSLVRFPSLTHHHRLLLSPHNLFWGL